MPYSIEFSAEFEKSMKKLKKKDKTSFEQIQKKLIEIVENPRALQALEKCIGRLQKAALRKLCSDIHNRRKHCQDYIT